MTNKSLEQLYKEHNGKGSDKWSSYLIEYERIFGEYKDYPINLLEIGVQNGGSLEIWSKYFANAKKLLGCDINPDCANLLFEDSRIDVVVGDANSDVVQLKLLQHVEIFDLIIDDGSHCSSDIVRSFDKYFPYLADGGLFVVEDLHCSYWAEFEGGLYDPFSSIMFFKRLADIVNYEHWGIAKSRTEILHGFYLKYNFQIDEDLLKHIHSIEFINSICVIRKNAPQNNMLGNRIISGLDESIIARDLDLQSAPTQVPSQDTNAWATRNIPPEEDVLRLENEIICLNNKVLERDRNIADFNKQLEYRDSDITSLKQVVAEQEGKLDDFYNSTSWRITRPLRFIYVLSSKILHKFHIKL